MEPQPGCSKDFVSQSEVDTVKCKMESGEGEEPQEGSCRGMLDLSDDVLLIILKSCSPRDLKALGFTCARLGRLVCDRSLWCRVDARASSVGCAQLHWYLDHTISAHTVSLALRGFAEETKGCLGKVDDMRPVLDLPPRMDSPKLPEPELAEPPPGPSRRPCFHFQRTFNPQLPRFNVSPVWRDDICDVRQAEEGSAPERVERTGGCVGPRWTLAGYTFAHMDTVCPKLTELRLEYVNINCDVTPISSFPPTLKALSLRGSRCFNLEMNKSYLFRIHDFLPQLEMVDVGLCGWMEPASLLPLSKLPELRTLLMDRCRRLSECVAYASLAARYGFRKLKVLNMIGTPMGDSEVSGLGWLPDLEELYLEPAAAHAAVEQHSHYLDDPRAAARDYMEPWEREEPEYFQSKWKPPPEVPSRELGRNGLSWAPCSAARTASPQQAPSARQRSRSDEELAQPKGDKCSGSVSEKPVTRSKSQQDSAEAAGPSASTRSKRPVVDAPPTSTRSKRVQTKLEDTPEKKRRRCQRAGPSTSQAKKSPKVRRTPKKRTAPANQEERPAEEIEQPNVEEINRELPEVRQNRDDENEEEMPPPREDEWQERIFEQREIVRRHIQQRLERLEMFGRRDGNEFHEDLDDYYGEGRVHVIYVNVRRPRRDIFRMLVQEEEPRVIEGNRVDYERAVLNVVEVPPEEQPLERPEALANGPDFAFMPEGMRQGINRDNVMNILRMPFIQNFLYGPPGGGHVSGASLITDASITRFGRSDNADIVNYVHIGPNGAVRAGAPPANISDRPVKSKLKVLVCHGFTGITNRSLLHLVTAAPDLRYIDVAGTKVTAQDAAAFKNLRPDCEIRYLFKEN